MKRRATLGFLLAAAVLGALIWVVGTGDILAELEGIDLRIFAAGFVSAALALLFRASVWIRLLGHVDATFSRWRIVAAFLVGMFAKYATPYGQVTTEPVMAYVVSELSEMEYEDGFAGILAADLLNYIPYYTLGALGLVFLLVTTPFDPDLLTYVLALGVFAVVLLSLTALVLYRRSVVERLAVGFGGLVRATIGRVSTSARERFAAETVRTSIASFYGTVDMLARDRRRVLGAVVLAHVGMAFLMLPLYLVALSLGYRIALPLVALIAAIGKMGIVVPTPGGLGGVETTITAALVIVTGLPLAASATIALLYRVCIYWFTIAVGGLTASVLVGGWSTFEAGE